MPPADAPIIVVRALNTIESFFNLFKFPGSYYTIINSFELVGFSH